MPLSNYIDQKSPNAIWHSLFSALAFKGLAMDEGTVTATLPDLADFRQSRHSGIAPAWLTVALDTLLGMAVFGKIMKAVPIATVDLSTDFMAELAPRSDANIRTCCDLIVGNTAFVSGTVHDSKTDTQIARCTAKFIIKGKPQAGETQRKGKDETPGYSAENAQSVLLFQAAKKDHPYANWLAAEQLEKDGEALIHLPFSELIIGDPFARTIHGGMLASIMELAAAGEIANRTGNPDLLVPLSSSINYLKRTTATACFASADIVRFGRNIIVLHARTWQQDPADPVATGTYLFKGLEAEG